MSKITRCPSCATMFKVVPDQLRISDGWVRCGHCKQVFDASAYLFQIEPQSVVSDGLMASIAGPAASSVAWPRSAPEAKRDAQPFRPLQEAVVPAAAADFSDDAVPVASSEGAFAQVPASVIPADEEASPNEKAPATPVHESAHGDELPSSQPTENGNGSEVPADGPPTVAGAVYALHAEDDSDDDSPGGNPGADELGFVRKAKRKAFWRSPLVRAALCGLAFVLMCSLVLQVVLHERDRIAAMDPSVRPWLQQLCEPFECALEPLQQISDVVIDSSSFNKGPGESYQLAFALKNRASVPLAIPAMELTLTDAQDQPVLRRVLLPHEMAAPAELPAFGVWTSSMAVIVTSDATQVAGYRLLAFYP